MTELDVVNQEMLGYMKEHGRAAAPELAKFTGISIPSVRMRLYRLMAEGIVGEQKTRNHRAWFFLATEKEKKAASRSNSRDDNTAIQERRIDNAVNSGQ